MLPWKTLDTRSMPDLTRAFPSENQPEFNRSKWYGNQHRKQARPSLQPSAWLCNQRPHRHRVGSFPFFILCMQIGSCQTPNTVNKQSIYPATESKGRKRNRSKSGLKTGQMAGRSASLPNIGQLQICMQLNQTTSTVQMSSGLRFPSEKCQSVYFPNQFHPPSCLIHSSWHGHGCNFRIIPPKGLV